MMTKYVTHPDSLRWHAVNHCHLLNAVRTKVRNETIKVLSVALCHKTYELSGLCWDTCHDVMSILSRTIRKQM